MKLKRAKQVTSDFLLRISSSVITTIANQIVLLPFLASIFSSEQYGIILTVVGVKNVISGTLGNSLFSTRLVVDSKYKEKGECGDFNMFSLIATILSMVAMIVSAIFIGDQDIITILLLVPTVALYTANAYFSVWYTIKLEFRKGLIHSIVVSIGTIIGVCLVKVTNLWPIAYLMSALFGLAFLTRYTGIFKESFRRTSLEKYSRNKWAILIITTLMTNLVMYLDRLLLYPLMGGDAVATFSTASYLGKAVGIIAMPISAVLLGYYSQSKFKMTTKLFWIINSACILIFLCFEGAILIVGEPITALLFPKLIQDSTPYLFIANTATAIAAIIQLVQSSSLKYAKTYWQIVIQVIYLLTYFTLGIALLKTNGLMGFCTACLISNIIRLIMLFFICHFSIKKNVTV